MADVKFRGYVSKPQSKSGSKGNFSSYTVSERIKDPKSDKGFRKAFYNVTDFNASEPPPDGAYVTIEGWLKPREYEANGQKRTSLDVIAQKVEIAPPRDSHQGPSDAALPDGAGAPDTTNDPWDLNA